MIGRKYILKQICTLLLHALCHISLVSLIPDGTISIDLLTLRNTLQSNLKAFFTLLCI